MTPLADFVRLGARPVTVTSRNLYSCPIGFEDLTYAIGAALAIRKDPDLPVT